jgi:phage tail sheath protein FI
MIELKNYIRQRSDTLVFQQNTDTTRLAFVNRVNPYLTGIQQKQGLYAFKVIMNDSNNTPSVIDQNQLVGQIYIQPTRTAEFISLDFILLPTGAEFPG